MVKFFGFQTLNSRPIVNTRMFHGYGEEHTLEGGWGGVLSLCMVGVI